MFPGRTHSLTAGCSQDGFLPWVAFSGVGGRSRLYPSIARDSRAAWIARPGQASGKVMPMGIALDCI